MWTWEMLSTRLSEGGGSEVGWGGMDGFACWMMGLVMRGDLILMLGGGHVAVELSIETPKMPL